MYGNQSLSPGHRQFVDIPHLVMVTRLSYTISTVVGIHIYFTDLLYEDEWILFSEQVALFVHLLIWANQTSSNTLPAQDRDMNNRQVTNLSTKHSCNVISTWEPSISMHRAWRRYIFIHATETFGHELMSSCIEDSKPRNTYCSFGELFHIQQRAWAQRSCRSIFLGNS